MTTMIFNILGTNVRDIYTIVDAIGRAVDINNMVVFRRNWSNAIVVECHSWSIRVYHSCKYGCI